MSQLYKLLFLRSLTRKHVLRQPKRFCSTCLSTHNSGGLVTYAKNSLSMKNCSPTTLSLRYKSSKRKKSSADQESDDDEEEESEDESEIRDYIPMKKYVSSLRLDLVMKNGLGISRSKLEEAFYESRIRRNGEKVQKKSNMVEVDDELDVIKSVSPDNPNFLLVSRVVVAKIRDEMTNKDKYTIELKRWNELTIENYPNGDPWK